jgi:hydroxypyruvate isomerase
MPRFSCNLGFLFTEVPFLARFAAAARAGFAAVEIADPYAWPHDEQAARLREHALACALINFPMGDPSRGDRGLGCLPGRVPEFRDSVALAIDTARALGCTRANCMAGRRPAGADPHELRATLVDNLRFAARQCARAGLTVCLEPLNDVDDPAIFLSGSAEAVAIIREVGEDNLQLQLDCYHAQIMEGDAAATVARLLPVIGHIQIGDVPGRHEPGTGTIDFPALFALLDEAGYRGWVGAEYRPSRATAETLAWLPRARPR